MKVLVNLKVNNAQDRDQDQLYLMDLDLQVFPSPGSSLVFKSVKEQRIFTVDYFSQVIEHGKQVLPPLVFLKAENQTFKGVSFASICEKLERLGFKQEEFKDG